MKIDSKLFTEDIPLIDVRAPVEFEHGAFPRAFNLPILDNAQREAVGICYKNKGPEAATRLGHELVHGDNQRALVSAWQEFINTHPQAVLYCFRGGQRSRIAQNWLAENGVEIERIEGGYKALRTFLLNVFNNLPKMTVVSGRTGTGKTELLIKAPAYLDLEGRANHRGSAFGGKVSVQPSQINFENAIAIDLLKFPAHVFVEDEGRLIGRLSVPLPMQEEMKKSSIILLEDTLENRVDRIFQEYVIEQLREYASTSSPLTQLKLKYEKSLSAIKKRLGGVNYKAISETMTAAFLQHSNGNSSVHKIWIESLLTQYYDPMYDYQLKQKEGRVIARGDRDSMIKIMSEAQFG